MRDRNGPVDGHPFPPRPAAPTAGALVEEDRRADERRSADRRVAEHPVGEDRRTGTARLAERRSPLGIGGPPSGTAGGRDSGAFELDDRLGEFLAIGPHEKGGPADVRSAAYQEIKSSAHRRLLEKLNLENLAALDRAVVVTEIRRVVHELLRVESTPLSMPEREQLIGEVLNEIFGLGPLEPLLADPTISDILVNTHACVYIERNGQILETPVVFKDDQHLLQIIDRIVSVVGRRIDDSSPMVDARLPDGSRVNAVIPPVSIDGPHLSIRKFRQDVISTRELVNLNTLTPPMLELLQGCVKARLNVLISGGTGAGKTTLLNILSSFIPARERIVTIEDSAELQLQQRHTVRMETRPPNVEGRGEITQRMLVINALRMRPDRIIVGEVRGGEAIDMLQAMNTGHDGSLTTIHANSPRDALARLETMVSMSNLNLPEKAIRQQTASAIQVVVQLARLSDGTRKVMTIAEIVGMEGEVITMQDIFTFERIGIDPQGRVQGRFKPSGIRPRFADRLRQAGVELPMAMFNTFGSPGDSEFTLNPGI
jgi:pilus assembly protein CpaF